MIFYADVYFLINFTVDVLALYFAVRISRVKSSVWRLVTVSVAGALLAVFEVLVTPNAFSGIILSIIMFLTVFAIIPGGASVLRRVKCTVAFFLLETLIGGIVSLGYTVLDKYFYPVIADSEETSPDRRLLILSVMILISVGLFKLLMLLFSHTASQTQAEVEVEFMGRVLTVDALVDTGNLLRDPQSLRPVILIKAQTIRRHLPTVPTDLDEAVRGDGHYTKRICLIPAKSMGEGRMLVGFRPDKVCVSTPDDPQKYTADAVIAVDAEGGTYGGFSALLPAAVLD